METLKIHLKSLPTSKKDIALLREFVVSQNSNFEMVQLHLPGKIRFIHHTVWDAFLISLEQPFTIDEVKNLLEETLSASDH